MCSGAFGGMLRAQGHFQPRQTAGDERTADNDGGLWIVQDQHRYNRREVEDGINRAMSCAMNAPYASRCGSTAWPACVCCQSADVTMACAKKFRKQRGLSAEHSPSADR